MNYSTYRFTLDLQKHQSHTAIAVFQYDTAVKFYISLTDGGKSYYIDDGCEAQLYGKRADGAALVQTCNILDNTEIEYEFHDTTASVTGVVECQIRLYGTDGAQIIATPKFSIVVEDRVIADEDVTVTDDEFSALDEIFKTEGERIAAEESRVEAEKLRKNIWIRYSANADGTDYTDTWSKGQTYIGVALSHDAPTDKNGYSWSFFKGDKGDPGDSAYEVAKKAGYKGTEKEWLEDLYSEDDPTVPAHVKNITADNINSWNSKAESDHTHNYLTSFTETDPTVPAHVKSITTDNIASWNGKANSNHTHSQYLTSETDPTVPAHVKSITADNINSWNAKSDAGHTHSQYLTSETDPTVPTHVKNITTDNIASWNAKSDSGHTHAQYLTSFTETDPTVPAHVKSITTDNIASWNGKAESNHTHSYIPTAEKGVANGVATLTESGKVPTSQLPAYVDDVIEGIWVNATTFNNYFNTAITGETGKVYVDTPTNKTYRWSGSKFVEISASLALGTTSSTAYRGDYGQTAYNHSQSAHAPSNAEANVQSNWKETNTSSDAYIHNKPTSLSEFTNDLGYLIDETDPTVPDCVKSITADNIASWNSKLTSETDPTVPAHVKSITADNINSWNSKAESDHTHSQYLTSETDPTVPAHVKSITADNINSWNSKAESDHTHSQYLTSETDPTVPDHVKNITADNIASWNGKAESGHNHDGTYLKEVPAEYITGTELVNMGITADNIDSWNNKSDSNHTHSQYAITDGETLVTDDNGTTSVHGIYPMNQTVATKFFVGTKEAYTSLDAADKANLFALITDDDDAVAFEDLKKSSYTKGLKYELYPSEEAYYCSGIEDMTTRYITIPSYHKGKPVIGISANAFSDTEIRSIVIPDTVEAIGVRAFGNCAELTSVTLGTGTDEISQYAFEGCTSLIEVSIPGSCRYIWNSAFQGCTSLKRAYIPKSVLVVGDNTFTNCPSLTIYVELGALHIGWANNWNASGCKVVMDANALSSTSVLHSLTADTAELIHSAPNHIWSCSMSDNTITGESGTIRAVIKPALEDGLYVLMAKITNGPEETQRATSAVVYFNSELGKTSFMLPSYSGHIMCDLQNIPATAEVSARSEISIREYSASFLIAYIEIRRIL